MHFSAEAQFWELLQQQVQELNKFATSKERQIQSDLRIIAARMEQVGRTTFSSTSG